MIESPTTTATVLLITDPEHAVPVLVGRYGVRLVAYGKGRSDQLELPNIPLSADVTVGDAIITSGLGGRFPPGFPVGTVPTPRPDDRRAFLVAELPPGAPPNAGRDGALPHQSRRPAAGVGNWEQPGGGRGPQPRGGQRPARTEE